MYKVAIIWKEYGENDQKALITFIECVLCTRRSAKHELSHLILTKNSHEESSIP